MKDITKVNPLIRELYNEIMDELYGITLTENESTYGWWETGAGADFGQETLDHIRELFYNWEE
jgi:hypothetical protein